MCEYKSKTGKPCSIKSTVPGSTFCKKHSNFKKVRGRAAPQQPEMTQPQQQQQPQVQEMGGNNIDELFDRVLQMPAEASDDPLSQLGAMESLPPSEDEVKRQKAALHSQQLIMMAYYNICGITEQVSQPYLNGFTKDVVSSEGIKEALEEVSALYGDVMGLNELGPEYRLILFTLISAGSVFTKNYLTVSSSSEPAPPLNKVNVAEYADI